MNKKVPICLLGDSVGCRIMCIHCTLKGLLLPTLTPISREAGQLHITYFQIHHWHSLLHQQMLNEMIHGSLWPSDVLSPWGHKDIGGFSSFQVRYTSVMHELQWGCQALAAEKTAYHEGSKGYDCTGMKGIGDCQVVCGTGLWLLREKLNSDV